MLLLRWSYFIFFCPVLPDSTCLLFGIAYVCGVRASCVCRCMCIIMELPPQSTATLRLLLVCVVFRQKHSVTYIASNICEQKQIASKDNKATNTRQYMSCNVYSKTFIFIHLFSLALSELADRLKCAAGCERGEDASAFILILLLFVSFYLCVSSSLQ